MITMGISTDENFFSPSDRVVQLEPFSSKRAMENAHLQHFQHLVKSLYPQLHFNSVVEGEDPPDFYITRGAARIGLEHTVFASKVRRERATFFAKIHDRLVQAFKSGRLRGLEGIKIDVSFGDLGGKPIDISEDKIKHLIQQFEGLVNIPRALPENFVRNSEHDAIFRRGESRDGLIRWYVSSVSNFPFRGSKLANQTGFEVECTFREWLTPERFRNTLEKCIKAKDHPSKGADELLIVAGAPDRQGRAFPAEAQSIVHYMESWVGLTSPPKHLKRIFIDVWWLEKIYIVYEA